MSSSFYFYDLETSGINPREHRIMQFAGQRIDMNLKPIAEPDNILIKLTDDVLPDPDAVLLTGITPQATIADGITEYEFLKYFKKEICAPETIFVGFNNIRFDDEFIRFALYRNFYDAYDWCWRENRSRWDILDLLRMTRALRPNGINWPVSEDGKPTNRLELMTDVNGLEHVNAHDALSDVNATIAVARLVRNKQPKLFDYLLNIRSKDKVKDLINTQEMFVYTSGRYPNLYNKTTIVSSLGEVPNKQGVLVYDLRSDPENFVDLSPMELAELWYERVEDETKRFPVKTLTLNKCPAVAPLSVLTASQSAMDNIKIEMETIQKNLQKIKKYPNFYNNLLKAMSINDKKTKINKVEKETNVDEMLYDGFFNDKDEVARSVVRAAEPDEISSLSLDFDDDRLKYLLPLYKARNFKNKLDPDETKAWELFRQKKLFSGAENSKFASYFRRINELSIAEHNDQEKMFLLEELKLYGESIMPDLD